MLTIVFPPDLEVGDNVLVGPRYTMQGYEHDNYTGMIMRIVRLTPYYVGLGDVETDDDTELLTVTRRRLTKVK